MLFIDAFVGFTWKIAFPRSTISCLFAGVKFIIMSLFFPSPFVCMRLKIGCGCVGSGWNHGVSIYSAFELHVKCVRLIYCSFPE